MKIRLSYLFVALLSVWLTACGVNPTDPGPNERFQPYPEESQILGLANAFRVQAQTCGTQQFPAAPAMTWVEAVGDTAWYHSIDMGAQDTENHVGASTVDRLRGRGFDAGLTAEHRKKTALPANPADAFNSWTADPVACADLMNPTFTVLGAGLWGKYEGGTAAYWTMILTTPQGTGQAALTLEPNTATVMVGGAAVPFTATLTNSAEAITWNLNGPGSFTFVGATATYTPPTTGGAGTATLTATAGALTASSTITINAATAQPSLTVTPTTATTPVNGTALQFTATLTGATDPITWNVTGPGTVEANGATATYSPPTTGGADTATLTATAGTLTASATITITAATNPGLTVTPTTALVAVGSGPIQFKSSTNQVGWEMTGVGTFSWVGDTFTYNPPATGTGGTATITVKSGTETATATVTVVTLDVTPATATVAVGGAAIPFSATLTSSTEPITWNLTGPGGLSSNTGTTTNYTPPTTGGADTATLTATVGPVTATATITINPAPVPILSVTPTTQAVTVGGAGAAFTATLTDSQDPITWTLDGPGTISSTTGATTTYTPPATGGAGTATLTATAGALTATATITINAPEPTYQEAFLALINAFRSQPQTCKNGMAIENMPAVPPVSLNAALNRAAQLHSQDMADNNYFAHKGLNGSRFWERMAAAGYTGDAVYENIAAGQANAQGAFDSWRNSSSGHCQSMMSATADEIGIGYAQNPNSDWTHYWTLVGGKKK